MARTIPSLLIACSIAAATSGADWTSWRGPSDDGSIAVGTYPTVLDESTLQWKTPLPGKGCSTPIVLGGTIYLTAPDKGNDALLAVSDNGKPLWTTQFGTEVAGKHRNGSGSNASPVTDGDAVFVYFKSGTLAAVEFDGSIRWQTNLVTTYGQDTLFWDHGTSPVLTETNVVIARMHNGDSWLAAFDKESGELSWKEARNYETPLEGDHGYSTPLVIEHQGRQALLVWGAQHLTIHNAVDGKLVWTCGNFNPESNKLWPSIAMPVIVGDIAVIAYGRNDRKLPRLFGIRLDGSGDVTSTNHIWLRDDISTFVPSPVAYEGRVFLVRDKGEIECIDPSTGATHWSEAFPKSRSSYYASPLIANDKLYAPREDGVVFVADLKTGKFELLSENDMQESVIGSPIPTNDRILIRGEQHLFCFGSAVTKN